MKEEDKVIAVILIIFAAIFIMCIVFARSAPELDNPEKPFVVEKINTYYDGYARYYNHNYNTIIPQKPIILKIGKYNINDTIKIDNK